VIICLVYTHANFIQYVALKACDWIPESELKVAQYAWHDKYPGVVVYEHQASLVGGLPKCTVRRYVGSDDSKKDVVYQVFTFP
jgi:hypothetical protein